MFGKFLLILCPQTVEFSYKAKNALKSQLSRALLCAKCFHHFVTETFWLYELQNGETQN